MTNHTAQEVPGMPLPRTEALARVYAYRPLHSTPAVQASINRQLRYAARKVASGRILTIAGKVPA